VVLQTPSRSVWDGVYTDEQAGRGNDLFMNRCATCHDPSEFAGQAFIDQWKGQTAFNLFDTIRTEMPKDNPGSLSADNYRDIVTFMFKANSFPVGKVELEAKDDVLKQIRIEPKSR